MKPHVGGYQLANFRALGAVRCRLKKRVVLLACFKLERPDDG